MSERKKVSPETRDELFAKLRRNILIARLKVTLDEELNRESTPGQKALAEMKLPPLRSKKQRPVAGRTDAKVPRLCVNEKHQETVSQCPPECETQSTPSAECKRQLFDRLFREILAARLKVTLDEQLNRETSDTVKALAGMKLPRCRWANSGKTPWFRR